MFKKFLVMLFVMMPAYAYAQTKTTIFCAYDYLEHCSDYVLSSSAAKKCMVDVGINLQPKCVQAMIDDGYVTKEQVIAFAKDKGVTIVDTPEGLKKVETVAVTEPAVVEEVPSVVKEEVPSVVKAAKNTANEVKETAKSVVTSTKKVLKKTYDAVKSTVSGTNKVAKKTYASVKKKAKNNVAYSNRSNIIEQNAIRQQDTNNGIIPTAGVNADFGLYRARPKGYSRNKFQYNWKQHMDDAKNGQIRSGGINAKF